MNKFEMVSKTPIEVAVECGKTYWWFACGSSDGAHHSCAAVVEAAI
jgi:hypothetical protein